MTDTILLFRQCDQILCGWEVTKTADAHAARSAPDLLFFLCLCHAALCHLFPSYPNLSRQAIPKQLKRRYFPDGFSESSRSAWKSAKREKAAPSTGRHWWCLRAVRGSRGGETPNEEDNHFTESVSFLINVDFTVVSLVTLLFTALVRV